MLKLIINLFLLTLEHWPRGAVAAVVAVITAAVAAGPEV